MVTAGFLWFLEISGAAMAHCCSFLADTKNVDGRGIEVARQRVNACVARGLSVIHKI